MPSVDYASLARKFGGAAAPPMVDYASLAAQFGGAQEEAPKKGITESFVDRGVDAVKGIGSLALEAGKAAVGGPMAQASFLPNLAANVYRGAVDSGAEAIARQLPHGAEDSDTSLGERMRAGAAAVPVVGPYVMNKVSDVEEGKGRQVIGETGFDLLSTLVPGTQTGRAAVGGVAIATVKGAKAVAPGVKAAVTSALPEIAGAAIGGTVGGFGGGAAGVVIMRRLAKGWVKERLKVSGAKAEAIVSKMSPDELVQIVKETSPASFEKAPVVLDPQYDWTIGANGVMLPKGRGPYPEIKPITKGLKVEPKPEPPPVTMRETAEAKAKPPARASESVADEIAARAARQKEHIAETYRQKASKDAKNVAEEGNLEEKLRASLKPAASTPSAAVDLAEKVRERVESLSTQGLSRAQIRASVMQDILKQSKGFKPGDVARLVEMVLGKKS